MTTRRTAFLGSFLLAWLMASTAASAAHVVPDRLTPGDAEIMVHVNVRQLLKTPIVKKHALEPLKGVLKHNDEVQQLLNAAGIDPLKDVDTISLSTSGNPLNSGKMLAVIRGDFDPAKARTAAEEWGKKHPGRIKGITEGELPMWEISGENKSFYAAFAGNKTLVMTASKDDTVAVVKRADETPQRLNQAMQTALEQIPGSPSLWLAMVVTDDVKQMLRKDDNTKEFAAALQSVTGGLELTDDAHLLLAIHTTSAGAAAKVKTKIDELMTFVNFLGAGQDKGTRIAKEVLDNVKVKTEKNDVNVRLQLTDAHLEKARKNER